MHFRKILLISLLAFFFGCSHAPDYFEKWKNYNDNWEKTATSEKANRIDDNNNEKITVSAVSNKTNKKGSIEKESSSSLARTNDQLDGLFHPPGAKTTSGENHNSVTQGKKGAGKGKNHLPVNHDEVCNQLHQKEESAEEDPVYPVIGMKAELDRQACLEKMDIRHVQKTDTALDDALKMCQLSQDLWQKGELDKALDALDKGYSLILEADTEDPKAMQQIDDLRFLISKRILEIYASRHIVVNGQHNEIPVVLNDHVRAEINRLTGREKNFFKIAYKRSGKYRPMIVRELKKAGLPVELSWLPLIESGYRVNALSPARALGLWQFIPSTGYKFGLKRSRYVDERLDPEKATHAAISYLKELHKIFGDWATVLAAYNCGEGRVLKVIRAQNVNYLDNFWDLYQKLPRETARYVPRFLATLHIVKNLDKYGLNDLELCEVTEYETAVVNKRLRLKNIARTLGIPTDTLRELNPELRYQILPGNNYELRVPRGMKKTLVARLDKIPETKNSPGYPKVVYHKVRRGDTISTIARKYGSSIRAIAKANNLNRRYLIVAGKVLKVPTAKSYRKKYQSGPRKIPAKHVVKSGDSLWILARRYNTTTKAIQRLNNLRTTRLHIGQKLRIPGAKGSEKKAVAKENKNLKKYYVKRGDAPVKIAKKHHMSLQRFLKLNQLQKWSKIYPGQTLYVE